MEYDYFTHRYEEDGVAESQNQATFQMTDALDEDFDGLLEGLEANDQQEIDERLNAVENDTVSDELDDHLRLNEPYYSIADELEDYLLKDISKEKRRSMIGTLDYRLERDCELDDFIT